MPGENRAYYSSDSLMSCPLTIESLRLHVNTSLDQGLGFIPLGP